MKKNMLICAVLVLMGGGAHAGFIDARGSSTSGVPHGNEPETTKKQEPQSVEAAKPRNAEPPSGASVEKVEVLERTQIVQPKRNLVLQPGIRLSHAIREWLQSQSIRLSWEAQGTAPGLVRDFEVEAPWMSSSTDLEGVLTEVLGSFGFTAELIRSAVAAAGTAEMVVVRNATTIRP